MIYVKSFIKNNLLQKSIFYDVILKNASAAKNACITSSRNKTNEVMNEK